MIGQHLFSPEKESLTIDNQQQNIGDNSCRFGANNSISYFKPKKRSSARKSKENHHQSESSQLQLDYVDYLTQNLQHVSAAARRSPYPEHFSAIESLHISSNSREKTKRSHHHSHHRSKSRPSSCVSPLEGNFSETKTPSKSSGGSRKVPVSRSASPDFSENCSKSRKSSFELRCSELNSNANATTPALHRINTSAHQAISHHQQQLASKQELDLKSLLDVLQQKNKSTVRRKKQLKESEEQVIDDSKGVSLSSYRRPPSPLFTAYQPIKLTNREDLIHQRGSSSSAHTIDNASFSDPTLESVTALTQQRNSEETPTSKGFCRRCSDRKLRKLEPRQHRTKSNASSDKSNQSKVSSSPACSKSTQNSNDSKYSDGVSKRELQQQSSTSSSKSYSNRVLPPEPDYSSLTLRDLEYHVSSNNRNSIPGASPRQRRRRSKTRDCCDALSLFFGSGLSGGGRQSGASVFFSKLLHQKQPTSTTTNGSSNTTSSSINKHNNLGILSPDHLADMGCLHSVSNKSKVGPCRTNIHSEVQACIDHSPTVIEEFSPIVLRYRTPYFRANAQVIMPPIKRRETWTVGWIQACDYMKFINQYGDMGW